MNGKEFEMEEQNIWGKFYKFMYSKYKVLDEEMWRQAISNQYLTTEAHQNQKVSINNNLISETIFQEEHQNSEEEIQ